jgi:hypothetical protein
MMSLQFSWAEAEQYIIEDLKKSSSNIVLITHFHLEYSLNQQSFKLMKRIN